MSYDWRLGFDPRTDCEEWTEGRRAHRLAHPASANPYPRLTTEHVLWRDGWEDGEHNYDRRMAAQH